MRFFKEDYQATLNERLTLLILGGGFLIVLASAIADPGDQRFQDLCPVHRLLGLHCPGCGMTRASRSILLLSFERAFFYNPLIIIVAPYIAYRVITIILGMITKKKPVSDFPVRLSRAIQVLFVLGYVTLFIVRTASWLWPAINPDGFLLPVIGK